MTPDEQVKRTVALKAALDAALARVTELEKKVLTPEQEQALEAALPA